MPDRVAPSADCSSGADHFGDERASLEHSYDAAGEAEVLVAAQSPEATQGQAAAIEGVAAGSTCHAGSAELERAGRATQASDILDRYAADYPKGPHDKPQSMCPAFGSLRVGLRMRRVATLLSGSACCVYGLTFVSHFYGARRSVGYVPFNSETLVTGKLFEDIRDAVYQIADPAELDAIIVTNLCVPTASGVPLRLLPKEIDGVRIIGIDVPGFGVPTHAEAKDILAAAMLDYARAEIEAGPVAAPKSLVTDRPTLALTGELFPADPMIIGQMIAPLGLALGPTIPCREWRELYAAFSSSAVAAIHPFYTASFRALEAAGLPILPSAPVGYEGTAAWLSALGDALNTAPTQVAAAHNQTLPGLQAGLKAHPIDATITLSGYEGSELLVARLLIECGATIPYVGTACPKTAQAQVDHDWLTAKGVKIAYRASLEDDKAAVDAIQPDLAIGTTPVVQHAKEQGLPALYFTNLISARPLFGPAGPASLAQTINAALGNKTRMSAMRAFFDGVGAGDTAGVWEESPNLQPAYRAQRAKKLANKARAEAAARMI